MIERWVEIDEFPRYMVSNTGLVFDRHRDCIVAQQASRNGYLRVHMWTPNGRKSISVSRLVAGVFFDCDITELEINHLDGDKTNNHISNLEICDRSSNMLHAFDTGLANPVFRPFRVRLIETDEIFDSTGQADRYLGVSSGSVSKMLRGLQPTVRGYTFERVF